MNRLFLILFFFLSPSFVFASPINLRERQNVINQTLERFQSNPHFHTEREFKSKKDNPIYPKSLTAEYFSKRREEMEKTLRKISMELALEYAFFMEGEQIFELIDNRGRRVSKLTYPVEGGMVILKGELSLLSKIFLGGRYGSSNFKKTICSDEDWNLYDPDWPYGTDDYVDYQITKQDCKSKVELFDVNLYYCFMDLVKKEIKQRPLSPKEETIFDYLLVDSLSLDVFTGYQQKKGRYRMIDPLREALRFDEGVWYYLPNLPANIGLDSFYEIEYKGPRLGLRVRGSRGKLTTKVWFAYTWLETEAQGWWNLRELAFWQRGENGYGGDLGWEATYSFTPWLSAGLGFNYLFFRQPKLKMYAVERGIPWWPGYQDRIRNANSRIYGLSLILKFIW